MHYRNCLFYILTDFSCVLHLCNISVNNNSCSTTSKHSKGNNQIISLNRPANKATSTNKTQKENDPSKEELKTPAILQSLKVSVVNDSRRRLEEDTVVPNPRLSVPVEVSGVKTVTIPNERLGDAQKDSLEDMVSAEIVNENDASLPVVEKGGGSRGSSEETTNQRSERRLEFDDYESPLQALGKAT